MVKLENINFSYPLKGGNLPVLSGITARFERGKITAIVGRSGCGKTSLLRIIAGLSIPSSGRLEVAGEPGGIIREKTSIIFQDYGLLPWASAQANAELGLRARGLPPGARKARVNPILDELGLQRFARLYPARLSGGMRQRVAVARALASDSDLLLLDEPFSSLDAITRESLQETLLETQRKHGTTIILVSHSIEEAAYLADTVYILGGKNPSTLSASFETGRSRSAPEALYDTAHLPDNREPTILRRGAIEKASHPSRKGRLDLASNPEPEPERYRESERYFADVAALRELFKDFGQNESNNEIASNEQTAIDDNASLFPHRLVAKFFAKLGKIVLAASLLTFLWAVLSSLLGKPFLPSPLSAAKSFIDRVVDRTLFIHTGASLRRIFLALVLAGPPAWALGLLSGRVKVADTIASPMVYFLHPLPKVAFLPLLMLFFGLGDASKVALMGLVVFGQLFVGARDSAKAIPDSLIDTVRSLGAGSWQNLWYAILPATLPSLLSSLRISLGTAIAVLFLSETFASMDGLGWYIMDSWSRVDYPDMYAAIMALSMAGLALYLALDAIEAYALRWRETD